MRKGFVVYVLFLAVQFSSLRAADDRTHDPADLVILACDTLDELHIPDLYRWLKSANQAPGYQDAIEALDLVDYKVKIQRLSDFCVLRKLKTITQNDLFLAPALVDALGGGDFCSRYEDCREKDVVFSCKALSEAHIPDLYHWLNSSGAITDHGIVAMDNIAYKEKLRRLDAFCKKFNLKELSYSDIHLAKDVVSSLFYVQPFASSAKSIESEQDPSDFDFPMRYNNLMPHYDPFHNQQELSWAFSEQNEDRKVFLVRTRIAPLQWQETCMAEGITEIEHFVDCFDSAQTQLTLKFAKPSGRVPTFQIQHGTNCLTKKGDLTWAACNARDPNQFFSRVVAKQYAADTYLNFQLRHQASNSRIFRGAYIHIRDAFPLTAINDPLSNHPDPLKVKKFIATSEIKVREKPDIYVLWLDTIRADAVSPSVMPHLYAFAKENISFEKAFSGGSSTRPTAYNVWNSRPATEWKYSYLKEYDYKGSTNLKILDRLGYHIHGIANQLAVIDEKIFDESGNIFDERHERLSESMRGGHIFYRGIFDFRKPIYARPIDDRCVLSDPEFKKLIPLKADEKVVDCFLHILKEKTEHPNAYLFWISGNHVPYIPLQQGTEKQRYPSFAPFPQDDYEQVQKWLWNEWYYGPDTGLNDRKAFINSYLNTATGTDEHLGRVLDALKSSGAYDNSIIVVMSDHGEGLFENATVGHGGTTLQKVIEAGIFYHFPKDREIPPVLTKVGAHMDIFPTIFDFMGLTMKGQDSSLSLDRLHTGRSVFQHNDCQISVQPNGYDYQPIEFSIFNGVEKLRARFRIKETSPGTYRPEENPLISKFLEPIALTDYWDRPLASSADMKELEAQIHRKFDKCFTKFFGEPAK